MRIDRLQFKWDSRANKQSAVKSRKRKNDTTIKSLEDYLDFIEEFTWPKDEKLPDQHVDKKFTLD